MSIFINQFENHPFIIDTYPKFLESLEKLGEIESLDNEQIEFTERFESFKNLIRKRLNSTDTLLFSQNILNQLNAQFPNMISEINQFVSNKNTGHLRNANNYIEKVLPYLSQIIQISNDDLDGLRESILTVRKSVGQHSRYIQEEYEKLSKEKESMNNKLDELSNGIDVQKSRIDDVISQAQNQISSFQQHFSEAQEKRLEGFAIEEQNRTDRFSNVENKRQNTFENSFVEMIETHNTQIKKNEEKFQILLKNVTDDFQQLKHETLQDITNLNKELSNHREHVERIIGVIANTGMVGGYQRIANDDYKASIVWNGLVVGSMIGLIAFSVYAFIYTADESFNWSIFASRAFVAATFGVLASYCSSQASRHQKAERQNRKMELELASIDPFLASLPEDVRNVIKGALTDKLFGQSEYVGNPEKNNTSISQQEVAATSSDGTPSNLLSVITQLLMKNSK